MRLKQSLRNAARAALRVLLIASLFPACTAPTVPTYKVEEAPTAIQNICKNEYQIEAKAKLVSSTLWIYLPVEDLMVKAEKPEKNLEKFKIEQNFSELDNELLKVGYAIKAIPEQFVVQEFTYNKAALEKINKVWQVLRRVIFSLDSTKDNGPKFFYMVTADIKYGFELKGLSYYLDLKKVSYDFISWGEYEHRSIQDLNLDSAIIGDKEGLHLDYRDFTLKDFILAQIQHRIKLKFQKPEVDKNADIDKEIAKIISYTVKTYDFKEFSEVELNNLLTNNKILLNRAAVWAGPTE